MTFKQFKLVIEKLEKLRERTHEIYQCGIDLLSYNEDYDLTVNTLLQSIFTSEGMDWIEWYLYERKSSQGHTLTATDSEGNQICHNIVSLWDTVKEHKL